MTEQSLFPESEASHFKQQSQQKKHSQTLFGMPLAARMSPSSLDDYVGQSHLLGPDKQLRKMIDAGHVLPMILWGPPGVGKTALAKIISTQTHAIWIELNAVMSKVQDIRDAIQVGRNMQQQKQRTIIFIDEIHRFNKAQQDALLPDMESGAVVLIGATTENPYFSVNAGILSRSHCFELTPLEYDDLSTLIERTKKKSGMHQLSMLPEEAKKAIIKQSHGDARRLMNLLELCAAVMQKTDSSIDLNALNDVIQQGGTRYQEDDHYNIISAFIKSIRGSDVDAALYWLARLIRGGEDPAFIARRLVILASEDIGNADPMALTMAVNGMHAVQFIGFPEARLSLSHVVIYLAKAPKSNCATTAIGKALNYVDDGNIHPVPDHLKDAHYPGAKKIGHGKGYIYPHTHPEEAASQKYWDGHVSFL